MSIPIQPAIRINILAPILFLFLTLLQIGCSRDAQSNEPAQLSLDIASKLIEDEDGQQISVPTIVAFDEQGFCIAYAKGKDIYDDSVYRDITNRSGDCPDLNFDRFQRYAGLNINENDNVTIVVLSDFKGFCKACPDILLKFETAVLQSLDDHQVTVHKIDVGMADWFSAQQDK